MPSHLSPSKICLVLLIQLYQSKAVLPQDTIVILSYISTHIINRVKSNSINTPTPHLARITDLQPLLSPLSGSFPGRSIYDVFLQRVWHLSSYALLDDLFRKDIAAFHSDTTSTNISSHSPIGQFLRRCSLEYARLPFDDAFALWEDFVLFREPSLDAWARRNPYEGQARVSHVTAPSDTTGPASFALLEHLEHRREQTRALPGQLTDRDTLDRTIHQQIEQLQTYGTRMPETLRQQLGAMYRQGDSMPTGMHFINFFESWRVGAYNDAIEHLHRYFDYALDGQQSIKLYHQYALLHLAVLHADFGCIDEAFAAMNECIATARENQDLTCLNFALSWLVHLRKVHPQYRQHEMQAHSGSFVGHDHDILLLLQQKAVENKDWNNVSISLLAQAEAEIRRGDGIVKALDLSYQSSHLNNKYALGHLMCSQSRLHSAIFARTGQIALSDQHALVARAVYGHRTSGPDQLSAICMQAYAQAVAGDYDKALEILEKAGSTSERSTLRMTTMLAGVGNMMKFRRAIHRNEVKKADGYLRQLQALRVIGEPDVAFEIDVLEIMHYEKCGNLTVAFDKVSEMAGDDDSVPYRAKRCSRGFSSALRAAASAQTRLLLPMLWEAVWILAVILLDHSEFAAARSLLESILPQASEGGGVYLLGRLNAAMLDAYVGLAGHDCAKGSTEQKLHMKTAAMYLERALQAFEKVEDHSGTLNCLKKKAILQRYMGETQMAAETMELYNAKATLAGA